MLHGFITSTSSLSSRNEPKRAMEVAEKDNRSDQLSLLWEEGPWVILEWLK